MSYIKEKLIESSPKPVTIQGTETILSQMKNSICKIYKCNGTGFFCNIIFQNFNFKALITNYHLIDKKYIEENKIIKISLNDEKEKKDIKELNKRKIYFNDKYDITIIEIKNSDNINANYLELDEKIFEDNSKFYYENKSIYILQYPNQDKASVSYGIAKKIEKDEINHLSSTLPGSSGSPILNLNNNKVIGIHIGAQKEINMNLGTLLRKPLKQFYKEKVELANGVNIRKKMIEVAKLNKIKLIFEKYVLGACKLTLDMLDERGNKDPSQWSETSQIRGGFNYYPPNHGWVSFGLKVLDQYDNGNNDWIAKDNNPNEWVVAYHGTSLSAVKPICQKGGKFFSTVSEGATSQKCKYFININKKSQNSYRLCEEGAYCSPHFEYAKCYFKGVIIMCRVNPNKLRIPSGHYGETDWITEGTRNSVRPYRILFNFNDD